MSRITTFYVLKSVTYLGLMGNSQNLQNQQNDIAVIHFCVLVTYTGERMYLTVNIKVSSQCSFDLQWTVYPGHCC